MLSERMIYKGTIAFYRRDFNEIDAFKVPRHGDNAVMHPWQIPVIVVLQLKFSVGVLAQ